MSEAFLERPTLHSQRRQREPFPPRCPERKGLWPSLATACWGCRGRLHYTVPSHQSPHQITSDTQCCSMPWDNMRIYLQEGMPGEQCTSGAAPLCLSQVPNTCRLTQDQVLTGASLAHIKGNIIPIYTDFCKNKGKQAVHVSPDQYWP